MIHLIKTDAEFKHSATLLLKMKYYSIFLLLVWSGNILAEGGAYWTADAAGNPFPWFESPDRLCQVLYDYRNPNGSAPSGNYPYQYKTVTYLGPEQETDIIINCRTEVCRKYNNYPQVECVIGSTGRGYKWNCRDHTIADYGAKECIPKFHVVAPPPPPPSCNAPIEGDPVDPLTGNLVLSEVDIPGSDGTAFTRHYSSMDLGQAGSNLGINWTHNSAARIEKTNGQQIKSLKSRALATPEAACESGWWNIHRMAFGGRLAYKAATYRDGACEVLGSNGEVKTTLSLIPDREVLRYVPYPYIAIIRPNGGRYNFHKETTGTWSNLNGKSVQLIENSQSWTLTLENGTTEIYGANGNIQQVKALDGNQTLYTYDSDDQLTQVTHPNGQITDFEYLDGQISRVTTPSGSVSYGYDAIGNLTKVTYPDNTSKQYRYENPNHPNHLTGIIDEKGDLIAIWSYDSLGRVTMNERAGGTERYSFTYSTRGNVVTDIAGASRTYHSDIVNGRAIYTEVTGDRCDNCAYNMDQQRSYDDKGYITSRTDWKGITTSYIRDERGLELSRTEAEGTPEARTITTEWHPDFRKPVRITEADRMTEYTYDENGRLLSKKERAAP